MINKDFIDLVYSYVPDRIELIKKELNNLTDKQKDLAKYIGDENFKDFSSTILNYQSQFEIYSKELDLLISLQNIYSSNRLI